MRSCLVIDDSRVVRKIACRILEELDFSAQEAENAEGALQSCRTAMPDLVLLDADMPDLDSGEFIRILRRERGGDKPLVIYCVTEIDVPHITQILVAGASDYMLKPYDRIAIRSKLAEVGMA